MRALRLIVPSIALGLVTLTANPGLADAERGAELAAMCAACHRLDGRDKAIPSILGMDVQQFTDAIAAFKSGARSSPIMHAVALQLSEAEIATLAKYLAARSGASKRQ